LALLAEGRALAEAAGYSQLVRDYDRELAGVTREELRDALAHCWLQSDSAREFAEGRRFLAEGLVHDVRNLLAPLPGPGGGTAAPGPGDKARAHALELVDELARLAALETPHTLHRKRFSLREEIDAIWARHGDRAPAITLTNEVPAGLTVYADRLL